MPRADIDRLSDDATIWICGITPSLDEEASSTRLHSVSATFAAARGSAAPPTRGTPHCSAAARSKFFYSSVFFRPLFATYLCDKRKEGKRDMKKLFVLTTILGLGIAGGASA